MKFIPLALAIGSVTVSAQVVDASNSSSNGIALLGNNREIMNYEELPSVLDFTSFGRVCMDAEPTTRTFTIVNTGTTELQVDEVSVFGEHALDFMIEDDATGVFAVGDEKTFGVSFVSGADQGTVSAHVSVKSNRDYPHEFIVAAHVENSVLGVTTTTKGEITSYDFAQVSTGSMNSMDVSIVNFGNCANQIEEIVVASNTTMGVINFTVTNPLPTTLEGGEKAITGKLSFSSMKPGKFTTEFHIVGHSNHPFTVTGEAVGEDLTVEQTGFEFPGCVGGAGGFFANLKAGEIRVLGDLPIGQEEVDITLTLPTAVVGSGVKPDLDAQLWDKDMDDLPVVGWCDLVKYPTCKRGVKPFADKKGGNNMYAGMNISYTGWGSSPERVYVDKTQSTMTMVVYAYTSGRATINYTWAGSDTSCCRGESACLGKPFSKFINTLAIDAIGDIPVGVSDLEIKLSSLEDVDIQLYDASEADTYPEGQAVVGFCQGKHPVLTDLACNRGLVNLRKGFAGSEIYKGMNFTYSGFNGEDGIKKGQEYIRIKGVTSVPLSMKAFGYAAGFANVTYSYMEQGSDSA